MTSSEGGGTRRVAFRATGRVQGVAFRACTVEQARRAGAAGWVRNRADGAVEGVVEGPAAAVEAVLDFLRRGPPHGRVDGLELAEETPAGETGFRIRP